MYIIIGLGNPEEEYAGTRHNMGFDAINKIASMHNIEMNHTKFNGIYGSGIIENEKVILVKPQTYMNLSGEAVREYANFYKMDNGRIVVIYDDIDIEAGTVKIRKKGGAGTHNGMKSVVQELGTEEFPRIRVGIGKPTYKNDMIHYVLGNVSEEEYNTLEKGIETASFAIEEIMKNGIDKAMNKYN